MNSEIENKFEEVLKFMSSKFGDELDLQALLFLIGIQELGKGRIELSKNEKLDVMHIAICTLLAPYGYYEYEGLDAEGWPHWKTSEKLPPLSANQQQGIMKQAIVDYFKTNELISEN